MRSRRASGHSAIQAAIVKKADVLVTGDIGHHDGLDAGGAGTVCDRRRTLRDRIYFYRRHETILGKEFSGPGNYDGADCASISSCIIVYNQ